jgi:class 3 adenylate cyclase/tetratricopeptide (TPR) repeat protein
MDITRWLKGLGLEQYEQAFRENDVDAEVLPELTAEDLIGLGVTSIGHRRKLLAAIAALHEQPTSTRERIAPIIVPAAKEDPSGLASSSAERRQLTVMFCDLVGSTALSTRLDPEDLRELIGAYHHAVAETVDRFDGFVAKYMGDGVLIYFGYPQAHENDAERAVRAGLAVIEAIAHLPTRQDLSVRLGIASGLAVVGDLIGAGAAQERGVIGETPNLAARLQTLAAAGTLVIAEGTRRQIGALFELEDLGSLLLAGFSEPQRAWRVLRESAVVSRFEALRSEATPLVGRDEELDLLLRLWQHAKAGEGQIVLVSGEPGIGKSRLGAAVSQRIDREPHTRLRYFCSPYHQDSPLYPFSLQLERAAGFARDDTVEQKLSKLGALLAPAAPGDDEVALVAELLSLPNCTPDLNLTPQRKREKLFEALLHQLEALARSRAILMVFDDVHWIDPTSRELLELTLDRVARMPVLLILIFRPEFEHDWSGRSHVTMLALSRLGGHDGAALVERLAGDVGLAREIVDEIVERADGVPLFVEELTKAVLESGDRDKRAAAVLTASPLPHLPIPATLHASLIARLDRLGPIAKDVAQIGAVLGREFGYDLIEPAAQRPVAELQDGLDRLVEAGLLFCHGVAPQVSYLFKHTLVQDAAYSTLLRARRRQLHARVAAVLEQQFADLVERQPELLARHYTEAGMVEPAIEFWRRAGAQRVAGSAHREAVGHFERALELLGNLPEGGARDRRELALTLALTIPLIAIHGFGSSRVESRAMRAKELADQLADSANRFAAHRVVWNSSLLRQPVPRTLSLARDLMDLAQDARDPRQLAIAHRALGFSLYIAGKLAEAADILARGAAIADDFSDAEFALYGENPSMVCRVNGGYVRGLMGFPDIASRLCDAGVAHARNRKNPHSLAWALCVASHAYADQGAPAIALRLASEAFEIAREHRLPQWLADAHMTKGWAMCHLGVIAVGLDLQEKGERDWRVTGAVLHSTRWQSMLAESYLLAKKTDAARRHLAAARAHCENYGENYMAAELCRLAALLSLVEGTSSEIAEDQLNRALSIAREQGARSYQLRSAIGLARLWGEQGKRAEARDLLVPIYASFTQGFDTRDLKEAKALLDELG